jgi:hypothetical protein
MGNISEHFLALGPLRESLGERNFSVLRLLSQSANQLIDLHPYLACGILTSLGLLLEDGFERSHVE